MWPILRLLALTLLMLVVSCTSPVSPCGQGYNTRVDSLTRITLRAGCTDTVYVRFQ